MDMAAMDPPRGCDSCPCFISHYERVALPGLARPRNRGFDSRRLHYLQHVVGTSGPSPDTSVTWPTRIGRTSVSEFLGPRSVNASVTGSPNHLAEHAQEVQKAQPPTYVGPHPPLRRPVARGRREVKHERVPRPSIRPPQHA
jgi:hypothetical protein